MVTVKGGSVGMRDRCSSRRSQVHLEPTLVYTLHLFPAVPPTLEGMGHPKVAMEEAYWALTMGSALSAFSMDYLF